MVHFIAICFAFIILDAKAMSENSRKDRNGPVFRTEPMARVEFSNSSGTELRCSADGVPTPKVSWQTREGSTAADVPGLRYMRTDGTLVFTPFQRPEYRQDVHDSVYQCVASNEVGITLSREVHVRGVIKQRFSPQVYDDFVVVGNTAVLRCHLPSFVREHVVVDSWIRSDDQILKITENRGRSYTVLLSGELLIYEAKDKDSNWSYRCQTRHKLTGEMVVSVSAGKIIVTEPHVSTLPRVMFSRPQVRAEEGTVAQLPCVAQGSPPPSYRWMKEVAGVLRPVKDDGEGPDGRAWLTKGTLNIKRVQFSDGGQYQCIVRNSIGERRIETTLIVTAPLNVLLQPPRQVLSIGQEATFSCNVTGYPVHAVTWKRDSRPLVADTRVRLLSQNVFHIASVRREDKGMYQCFAHNDKDSAQGAAQLSIADVSPSIISAFVERSTQPGERVMLKCVSTGNPVPEVVWYLDGETLGGKRSHVESSTYVTEHGHVVAHLNITDTIVEDGGEYRCEVTNDVGSAFHAARLNVYGPPFVRSMKNITAISGKDLTIKCPYGGHPVKGIRWFKNGMMLPLNHRQRVSHGGTLIIQGVQRAADQDQYSCVARSSDGTLTATSSTYISVVVSPVIDAHFFRETATVDEGSRAKLMCVVTQGDPPLRFQWLKNGQPFLAHGDTTVHTFEDTSIVTFKKVSSDDRGTFTCTATNMAESTNMSMQLVVNVPPQWTVEPQNATVVLKKTVWMDCGATGFPAPSLLWKKLIYTESAAGDFTYVHSNSRAHRFNNGTLVLSEVEDSDAGSYLCQASNGIGAGLSKIIELKVLIPPKFEDPYQSQTVVVGRNTTLKCIALGDPPIKIEWQKNKEMLDTKQISRYSVVQVTDKGNTKSELRMRNVSKNDTGMYTCLGISDIGSDDAVVQLIVQGPPDAPTNITVTNVSSRSVSLQWEVLHNGNSHITGSIVQYKTGSDNVWSSQTSQLIVSGTETGATLLTLLPVTTYFIRITSENALGRGPTSEIINVTTEEEAPNGAPRGVQVHSTGAQSMKVSWMLPPEENHNGFIRGFYVGYRPSASPAEPYHFKKVERDVSVEQQSTYITSLKPFTKYDIVVKAYNGAGPGPKSSKVTGKTLETAPPTSPIVNVESISQSSLEISWKKDEKDKSAITEYVLHYKPDDGEWHQERLSSGRKARFVLTGLKCGTRYHLYMTASNSLGTGEPSVPVTAKTKGDVPMAPPLANTFLSPNSTLVVLHLNKWQSSGCPIQSFLVQHRPKFQSQWIATSERLQSPIELYVLRHLSPDREYMLNVTAQSEAGSTHGEYKFRTMPSAQSSMATSSPAFGKRETDQPFYKNVALVISIVVSSLVLLIVVFTVAVCLRKHSSNRNRRLEYDSRKPHSDSLMMTDIGKHCNQSSTKSSHYDVPAGKGPDYAEPYSCNLSTRQGSDGLFATIKRYPTRPIYLSSSYKQGSQSQPPPISPPQDGSVSSGDNTTGKWASQSSSSQKPVR